MTEKDPGSSGKKLSKSDDDTLERRNKSYEKVLDAQIAYVRAVNNFDENAGELGVRWMKKAQWHEKEFGW
jgi:hypothetical protein